MLLRRNVKCYEEKSYHYQIYNCFKVKLCFHEKLFRKEKNKLLLWIYAWWLSGHLWFNSWQKLPVTSLNWNPVSGHNWSTTHSMLKSNPAEARWTYCSGHSVAWAPLPYLLEGVIIFDGLTGSKFLEGWLYSWGFHLLRKS